MHSPDRKSRPPTIRNPLMKTKLSTYLIAASVSLVSITSPFSAHSARPSEASEGSVLLTASVVGLAVVIPVALSMTGAALVVRGVEASARGTVYVLERVSDGARTSIEVAGKGVTSSALVAGTVLVVTVIGSGIVLSTAGEAIAYIPNKLGRTLLHNERLTK